MRISTNPLLLIACTIAVAIAIFGVYQVRKVEIAHSTFQNYYAFRGCVQLLDMTTVSADCMLASGKTIKLVEVRNKWYLNGDLPVCWQDVCF
jgi:hypothetical protein